MEKPPRKKLPLDIEPRTWFWFQLLIKIYRLTTLANSKERCLMRLAGPARQPLEG
jgi:hypothetical protein